jgi:prepilin-type N-terminal cleavage/methylation domain-containing protein
MNFVKGHPRPLFMRSQGQTRVDARGFTLIEVLVTLVVISIGMLSVAQLQARALQHSHSSLQRTVAVVQANDLLERMWSGYCSPEFPNTIFTDWQLLLRTPCFPEDLPLLSGIRRRPTRNLR